EIIKYMTNELYAGITDQIGRNAFYISVGISILYSTIVIKNKNISKKNIFLILLSISLLSLLLTGKRGHLVANIFSMLFVTSVYTKIKGKSVVLKILMALIAVIILLYLL